MSGFSVVVFYFFKYFSPNAVDTLVRFTIRRQEEREIGDKTLLTGKVQGKDKIDVPGQGKDKNVFLL